MPMASTPKGERRRRALVRAAAQLLAGGGFDAIRHRAVAERAGLPLASTTYYFASLEELVTSAVDYEVREELATARSRLEALPECPPHPLDAVELVLDLLLGPRSHDGGTESVLLRYEGLVGLPRRPYLGPLIRERSRELLNLLRKVLARGGMPVAEEQVIELITHVDGTVIRALIEIDVHPRAAARQMLCDELGVAARKCA